MIIASLPYESTANVPNQRQMRLSHLVSITFKRTFIVKSKNTYTLSFGFTAFVVAQFIAPRTFIVVF